MRFVFCVRVRHEQKRNFAFNVVSICLQIILSGVVSHFNKYLAISSSPSSVVSESSELENSWSRRMCIVAS